MGIHVIGGLTLAELAAKTWRETGQDNCLGRAAELAFYFLLALFPFLIVLLSLISFLPGVQETILDYLDKVMPGDAMGIIQTWFQNIVRKGSGGLLSFGLLFSLWVASTGMRALMDALNTAYDIEEGRRFWKARLVALGLTLALALMVVGGAALVTFGDRFAAWVADQFSLGESFALFWQVVDYLLGIALLVFGMGVIYYFAPNARRQWRLMTPGAVFAVASFLLASFLFSLYLQFAPSYDATYGSLGAVIVLMLWLYLLGLVMLVGGEINAIIEKAAGKRIVEKEKPKHRQAGSPSVSST